MLYAHVVLLLKIKSIIPIRLKMYYVMHDIDVPIPILKIHVMKHNSQPIQKSTNCMQNKCYSPHSGCHDEQFKTI